MKGVQEKWELRKNRNKLAVCGWTTGCPCRKMSPTTTRTIKAVSGIELLDPQSQEGKISVAAGYIMKRYITPILNRVSEMYEESQEKNPTLFPVP